MKKSDAVYIISSAFAALTGLFYAIPMILKIRFPRYYPTQHVWKWTKEPDVCSQAWYGRQAFAFLGAAAVCVVLWFVLRRLPGDKELSEKSARSIGIMATILVGISMAYILCHEYNKWGVF